MALHVHRLTRNASKRWLAESARPRTRDRWFLKRLKNDIGKHPVSSVADPDVLEELRENGLAEGRSHSTVDRMTRTVRAVLRACVRWRYLEAAPHVPMYGGTQSEPRFLTQSQFAKLCNELPPHLNLAARFRVLTLLRMRSQSRLTWDRVDLQGARAWVPSKQMKGAKTFGFPLSPEAVQLLREARRLSPDGERVFQYDGKPVENFNTRAFKKAA
jgi:integrase